MAVHPNGTRPRTLGVRLDTIKQEKVQWRSRGRLARGKITILDGDPGLGKSTVLMDWAASFSRGEPLPDGDPQRDRGVLLICAEDDPADTIAPRLRVMNADMTQIYLLTEIPDVDENSNVTERFINLPDDVDKIRAIIQAYKIGLVIIDPLVGFMREDLKANSDQDVRAALQPLAKMLQETGASCVLVRHLNKGQSSNSLYRGGGSIGIIGIARLGLMVVKDPKDPQCRILASTKSNIGPPPPSLRYRLESVPYEDVARVVWLGSVDMTADELLADHLRTDEQKSDDEEAEDFLNRLLAHKPVRKQEMQMEARNADIPWRAVQRAIDKLRINKRPVELPDGSKVWVWYRPGINPNDVIDDGGAEVAQVAKHDVRTREFWE
jgi:hypothetical protein